MIRVLVIMCCMVGTPRAYANERPASERASDGLGFALTTGGLTVAGAFVGVLASAALDTKSSDGWLSGLTTGVGLGALAGFVGGGLLFDEHSDGDGSMIAAAGGAVLGLGVAALIDDKKSFWLSWPVLTVVGAAAGYALVDAPDGSDDRPSMQLMGLSGRF